MVGLYIFLEAAREVKANGAFLREVNCNVWIYTLGVLLQSAAKVLLQRGLKG